MITELVSGKGGTGAQDWHQQYDLMYRNVMFTCIYIENAHYTESG